MTGSFGDSGLRTIPSGARDNGCLSGQAFLPFCHSTSLPPATLLR